MIKLSTVRPEEERKQNIYESRDTPLIYGEIIIVFSPEISKFLYIKKYKCSLQFDT